MGIQDRAAYCVFYLGQEGELLIRENIGVDDVAKIFRDAEASNTENDVLVFNMRGIAKLSDIANHPENVYSLIIIKQGQLQVFEGIDSEIEDFLEEADHYYIVDDVFIISDAALRQLVL